MKPLVILLGVLAFLVVISLIGVKFWFKRAIASLDRCQAEIASKYKLNTFTGEDFVNRDNKRLITKEEFDRIRSSIVNEDEKCFKTVSSTYHLPVKILHEDHDTVIHSSPPPLVPTLPVP